VREKEPTRKNFRKKGAGVINRDVGVFAFFLFLAFIFWYLNSLGKETEAAIKYQVKYINLPGDRIIREEPKAILNLYLRGQGSSILKLKLSENKAPVAIDISKVNYKRLHGSKELNYFIVTSALTKSLALQLGSGFEVTSIKPDTLFFTLDVKSSKPEENTVSGISPGRKTDNQGGKK
jgi:hypothetical protein